MVNGTQKLRRAENVRPTRMGASNAAVVGKKGGEIVTPRLLLLSLSLQDVRDDEQGCNYEYCLKARRRRWCWTRCYGH
jgi:hypothetical protein